MCILLAMDVIAYQYAHLGQAMRFRIGHQIVGDGRRCDRSRFLKGIAIDAGGNGRKRDRRELMLGGELQSIGISLEQEFRVSALFHSVPRTDRMDDVSCRQCEAWGDDRLARLTGSEWPTMILELGPSSSVDGSAHAAATNEVTVSRIDDRIDVLPGDIPWFEYHHGVADRDGPVVLRHIDDR